MITAAGFIYRVYKYEANIHRAGDKENCIRIQSFGGSSLIKKKKKKSRLIMALCKTSGMV